MKIDGSFVATVLETASVVTLFFGWKSITEGASLSFNTPQCLTSLILQNNGTTKSTQCTTAGSIHCPPFSCPSLCHTPTFSSSVHVHDVFQYVFPNPLLLCFHCRTPFFVYLHLRLGQHSRLSMSRQPACKQLSIIANSPSISQLPSSTTRDQLVIFIIYQRVTPLLRFPQLYTIYVTTHTSFFL